MFPILLTLLRLDLGPGMCPNFYHLVKISSAQLLGQWYVLWVELYSPNFICWSPCIFTPLVDPWFFHMDFLMLLSQWWSLRLVHYCWKQNRLFHFIFLLLYLICLSYYIFLCNFPKTKQYNYIYFLCLWLNLSLWHETDWT